MNERAVQSAKEYQRSRCNLDVRTPTGQFISKLSTGFAEIIDISLQLLQHFLQVTDRIIILLTSTITDTRNLHVAQYACAHQYTIR